MWPSPRGARRRTTSRCCATWGCGDLGLGCGGGGLYNRKRKEKRTNEIESMDGMRSVVVFFFLLFSSITSVASPLV